VDIYRLEKNLRNFGYDKEDYESSQIGSQATITDDFTKKNLNHTTLNNCVFSHTNFDFAAVTGSIFKSCKFYQCSMYQPDFQFCNFYDCEFITSKTIVSTFNNCNFIGCRFADTSFEACTFTGAFFEDCKFRNVSIKSSTLENAFFLKCLFIDMNLTELNMNYSQIEAPTMSNVILPFSQIPYIFGCAEYIAKTKDSIKVSSSKGKELSAQEYIETVIPMLIQYWNLRSDKFSEFFFPLANIHLVLGDFSNASKSLKMGLMSAASSRDFRMIKFYCKLISNCNLFNPNALQKFYNLISRFGSNTDLSSAEIRCYMRNIGEIKGILFSSNKKTILNMVFGTNINTNDSESVGKIIGKLFTITKMKDDTIPNCVEVTLSENSPLMISLQISGNENNILKLLPFLFAIAKMDINNIKRFIPDYENVDIESHEDFNNQNMIVQAKNISNDCDFLGIHLNLFEYQIINCPCANSRGITTYYSNSHEFNELGNYSSLLIGNNGQSS